MLRNILLATAGLLAVSTACGQTRVSVLRSGDRGASQTEVTLQPAPAPPDTTRFRVREYAPFAAFEYEVLNKGDDRRAVYTEMWTRALRVCEEQNGYVTEYHDGNKHNWAYTREAGLRERANATCALEMEPPAAAPASAPAESQLIISGDAVTPGSRGNIIASGDKRQAYVAARDKAYQTCLGHDRRIDRMSVAFHEHPRVRAQVVFACSAGSLSD